MYISLDQSIAPKFIIILLFFLLFSSNQFFGIWNFLKYHKICLSVKFFITPDNEDSKGKGTRIFSGKEFGISILEISVIV